VSFIGGGNRSTRNKASTDLPQVTDKRERERERERAYIFIFISEREKAYIFIFISLTNL
jgi:hypothetical protein